MSTSEFDQWVQRTRKKCEKENSHPAILKENLLERLDRDIYSLDSSIISVVNALKRYESGDESKANEEYSETIELIDTILPKLYDRDLLISNLLIIKANILYLKRLDEEAAIQFNKSIFLLQPLHLEVDQKRIQSMLSLIDVLLLKDKHKEKAENLYLDILSYPWTLIEDPEYFQIFRDYYLKAGMGLIKCRAGNLEGLRNIYFVPASHLDLMPILSKAIEKAEEKQE